MSRPPVRWADSELPKSLSSVLESARHADTHADAAAVARMRARLRGSLGPAFERRVPARSQGLLRGKWLAGGALVIVGVSLFGMRTWQAEEAVHAADSGAVRPEPAAAGSVQRGSAAPGGDLQREPAAASGDVQAEPAVASGATAVSLPATPALPPAARSPKRHAQPSAAAPAKPGLAEELQGIERIRQLLATSPTRALAAAEAEQQRFAHGVLTPERELLRVEALVRAGRVEEARARAASSKQYKDQLEKLLAGQKH